MTSDVYMYGISVNHKMIFSVLRNSFNNDNACIVLKLLKKPLKSLIDLAQKRTSKSTKC